VVLTTKSKQNTTYIRNTKSALASSQQNKLSPYLVCLLRPVARKRSYSILTTPKPAWRPIQPKLNDI